MEKKVKYFVDGKSKKKVGKDDENQERKAGKSKNNNDKPEPHTPLRSKIHLKNHEDIRRLLSSTINELRRYEINPTVGGKVVYAASVMIGLFEQTSLEARLERIEQALMKR